MQTPRGNTFRHASYGVLATVVGLVFESVGDAQLTVVAPIAMTWLLAFATGARLLERTMMKRPGYPEYAARTSMFLPLPPRRS